MQPILLIELMFDIVRNKTIIGLKYNRHVYMGGGACVRNKTIIGLKYVLAA